MSKVYSYSEIDSVATATLIYQTIFNRVPDAGGLEFWTKQLESGVSAQTVSSLFLTSPEYHSIYDGQSSTQIVTIFYANALGRAPDQAGFDFWKAQLDKGVAPSELATYFANSSEAQEHNLNGVQRVVDLAVAGQVSPDVSHSPLDNSPNTVTVIKEVPGPTVYVPVPTPTEPTHVVDAPHVGSLDVTSTKNFDGLTQSSGNGNYVSHFLSTIDHTSNNEFGLQAHYRTGDAVGPVQSQDETWVVTMDSGHQVGGVHNVQGDNLSRSAATVDISMNFGLSGPKAGQYVLEVEGHQFTLQGSGQNWGFADAQGNFVQGLTMSADGHVLQDTLNFGFAPYSYLPHSSANSGDLAPQDVHVSLTEMVGTVGVAHVAETLHLV